MPETQIISTGRPTLYVPDLCALVIQMGLEGKSKAQMAKAIGISRQTLDNWCRQHPAFLDAITRARDYALAWWEETAQGNLQNRDFNAALWAKSMSARFPDDYSTRIQQEFTNRPTSAIEGMTSLEIASKLEEIRQRALARLEADIHSIK